MKFAKQIQRRSPLKMLTTEGQHRLPSYKLPRSPWLRELNTNSRNRSQLLVSHPTATLEISHEYANLADGTWHCPPMLVDKTNFGLVLYNHGNFYRFEETSSCWSVKLISLFLCFSLVNQWHTSGITVYNSTLTNIENTVWASLAAIAGFSAIFK